jgi:hypothetical protein
MGQPREQSARKAVMARIPEHTLLLREHLDAFAGPVTEHNWETAVYMLLKGVCAARDLLQHHDRAAWDWEGLGDWSRRS